MPWEMERCDTSSVTDHTRKRRKHNDNDNDADRERKKSRTSSKPDRLTSLPDQLLGHVLSLLPTKDVAAMQLSSKSLGHVFSLITSIDLDDLRVSPSRNCPLLVQRFPLFKSFVSKMLLQAQGPLARFRLRFGGDILTYCYENCYPNVEPCRLNVWLSYPLSQRGLRDLELTFRISNPGECKLPPQLFDFPSLQSFTLDANIKINTADVPLICLPNLKLLKLHTVVFNDEGFVTSLLPSCPALEDLTIRYCGWEKLDRITIASHSLRTMVLCWGKLGEDDDVTRPQLVTIDTPNLRCFSYGDDDLAYLYSITQMKDLVEAKLAIVERQFDDAETSVQSQLSLLRGFTDVQHLSLSVDFLQAIAVVAEIAEHLPVFRNLRSITLPSAKPGEWRWNVPGEWRWDIVLLLILHSSPLLETLVFPRGLFNFIYGIYDGQDPPPPPNDKEEAYMEAEGWKTNTLPSSCLSHLKRIEFGHFFGTDRELNMIKFFLGKASGLKELVLGLFKNWDEGGCWFPAPNFEEFVSKLEELPRASNSCSFIVRQEIFKANNSPFL